MSTNLRPLFQSLNPSDVRRQEATAKSVYCFSRYLWVGDNHFDVYIEAKINKPTENRVTGETEHNINIDYLSFFDTDSGAEFDLEFKSNSVEELQAFQKLYADVETEAYRYIINHRTEITDGY